MSQLFQCPAQFGLKDDWHRHDKRRQRLEEKPVECGEVKDIGGADDGDDENRESTDKLRGPGSLRDPEKPEENERDRNNVNDSTEIKSREYPREFGHALTVTLFASPSLAIKLYHAT